MTNNELNIAVAEKVMELPGVRMGVMRYWFTLANCGYTADDGNPSQPQDYEWPIYKARETIPHPLTCNGLEKVPDYAGDIAAAWQVVEKMNADGYWIQLSKNTQVGGIWRVHFGVYSSESESCSEAICLAALKALEGTR